MNSETNVADELLAIHSPADFQAWREGRKVSLELIRPILDRVAQLVLSEPKTALVLCEFAVLLTKDSEDVFLKALSLRNKASVLQHNDRFREAISYHDE